MPSDGHVREGCRSLPQCGPLFKLGKNRGTKLVETTKEKLIVTAVGLLGTADIFRQFEQGGFIKQRFGGGQVQLCRGGQGGLRLPGCLPLCPVVPEGVVAFVLVEADTVAEFGAYLVDARRDNLTASGVITSRKNGLRILQ